MSTLQQKQVKSQKQHLKILGPGGGGVRGAEGREKQIPELKAWTDIEKHLLNIFKE